VRKLISGAGFLSSWKYSAPQRMTRYANLCCGSFGSFTVEWGDLCCSITYPCDKASSVCSFARVPVLLSESLVFRDCIDHCLEREGA